MGKTMNERIMTDKVKWVKRTIHFGRKHRSLFASSLRDGFDQKLPDY